MSEKGLSRRQFLGGTAAVATAAAVPLSTIAPAAAFAGTVSDKPAWPTGFRLDEAAAGKYAYEIYWGGHAPQGG